MIGFVVVAACSLAVALMTAHRLRLAIAIIFVVAFIMPMQLAGPLGTVGGVILHPATTLIAVVTAVHLVTEGEKFLSDITRSWAIALPLWTFVAATQWTTLGMFGSAGEGLVVNQVVAPLLLFGLVLRAGREDPRSLSVLARVVVATAVFEALFAVGVVVGAWPQPVVPNANPALGTTSDEVARAFGTTDNPLILSGLLVMGVCLLPSIASLRLQLAAFAPLMIGLLITQSRTGIVVAGSVYLVRLLTSRRPGAGRFLAVAGVALIGVVVVALPWGGATLGRFTDDSGSAMARQTGYGVALRGLGNVTFFGGGVGDSYHVSYQAGRGTSFENPFLMYSYDFGALFAFAYFVAMAAIVVMALKGGVVGPGLLAAAALATALSFNSVAVNCTSGFQLWGSLGLALASAHARSATTRAPVGHRQARPGATRSLAPSVRRAL